MSGRAAPPDRGAAPDPGIFETARSGVRGTGLRGRVDEAKPITGKALAGFTAPPPDPALTEATIPYLPRGVRLADDRVRRMRVLHAPERAMQLDAIGDAIVSALDGRTLGAIIEALAAQYAAPRDQIAGDVTAFLQGLIDRRMVFVRLP